MKKQKTSAKKGIIFSLCAVCLSAPLVWWAGVTIYDKASLNDYEKNKNYVSLLSPELPLNYMHVSVKPNNEDTPLYNGTLECGNNGGWFSLDGTKAAPQNYDWTCRSVFGKDGKLVTSCEREVFIQMALSIEFDFSLPHSMSVNKEPEFRFTGEAATIHSDLANLHLTLSNPVVNLVFQGARTRDSYTRNQHCHVEIKGSINGEDCIVSVHRYME